MNKTRHCFLHVPKAGGSAVIASLQAALGAEQVIHANESRDQHVPLAMLLERYPLVAGHFTFAQMTPAILQQTFVFTFLREPLDRALSHYYYYREQPPREDYDRRVALARTLSLPAFVEQLAERPSPWSNWQTFIFSGAEHAEQPAEALLPAALRNLEQLDFVGVHEALSEGLSELGRLRGWPVATVAPRVNVTQHRQRDQVVDPAARARLRALNACDEVLHARARELWEEVRAGRRRVSSAGPAAAHVPAAPARGEHGTREVIIADVSVNTEPPPSADAPPRERIAIRGVSHVDVDDVTIGIRLTDTLGAEVYGVNTLLLGIPVTLRRGETFEVEFVFDQVLAPGRYYLTVAAHAADDHLHKCYHWIDNALVLDWTATGPRTCSGLVDLRARAALTKGEAPPVSVRRG